MSCCTSKNADDGSLPAPRYQPLVIVLAAVCLGIVVDRMWPLPLSAWWAVATGAMLSWYVARRLARPAIAAVLLCMAISATAASWHHCRWYLFAEDEFSNFSTSQAQPVCIEAIAMGSPKNWLPPPYDPMRAIPANESSQLNIKVVRIRDGENWKRASGVARVSVQSHLGGINYGDRLRIFAKFSDIAGSLNPGEFDYAIHGRADRCGSRLRTSFKECVSVMSTGKSWSPWRIVNRVRDHGKRVLRRHVGDDHAGLAAAVLLGAKERLEPDQTDAFIRTGTIHLLAISGLHVGILAGAMLFVVRRLPIPRGWGLAAVAGSTVFYMVLTDARPPVIRATILVLMACGALWLGRRAISFNSLAAAALVVLLLNPADLFRVGAQLSFLAVAGLMWFAPGWIYSSKDRDPLARLVEETRGWLTRLLWATGRSARHLTLVTATIWLLVLPLVMARFNLLTPIALVLNTLLWIPMAFGLMSGFATLVFGTLCPPLGEVFGVICRSNLGLLQSSVSFAQDIPGSHYWVPGPPDWWLLGFYGTLALMATVPRIRPPRRWCLALLAAWIAVGFTAAAGRGHPERLDCTFLSMGHGCATVLETPSGKTLLYDAGRLAAPYAACRSISSHLWSRGTTHIDAVVLSHADTDHYNALPELLERFSVGVVYVSSTMFDEKSPALLALHEATLRHGVPLRVIQAGDLLDCGDECRVEVLHPGEQGVFGGDNANSIVLMVECFGQGILLPGDLDSPGLDDILAEEPRDCHVLLAPHHGSRRSNPPGMAAWATPEIVIVSGSRRWDPALVEQAYRTSGSRVLHTAETGAITVAISDSTVTVRRHLEK
jgi:competence protein ComEC